MRELRVAQTLPNGTVLEGFKYAASFLGGNVGIGTTSPAGNLHVKSSGNSTYPLYIEASDGSNLGGMYQGASGNGSFYVRDTDGNAKAILQSLGVSSFLGGGIAIGLRKEREHRLQHSRIHAGGGVVIHEDWQLQAHGALTC